MQMNVVYYRHNIINIYVSVWAMNNVGKRGLPLTWRLCPVWIILKFCRSYNYNSLGKLFILAGNNLSHRYVLSARLHKVVFDVLIIIIILRFPYFCLLNYQDLNNTSCEKKSCCFLISQHEQVRFFCSVFCLLFRKTGKGCQILRFLSAIHRILVIEYHRVTHSQMRSG